MKKILAAFIFSCLLGFNFSPVFAEDEANAIKDVAPDFWAKEQIENVISSGIMQTDADGNFNPDKSITRVDFVTALLKILSNDNLDVKVKNKFSDINEKQAFYNDVLRSEQLGLVYGYPDGTFQPEKNMLRSETASVISHITKDKFIDCAILNSYTDKDELPSWSKIPYAKSINYGIFVNHPDEKKLEPNRDLSRAEAAVLFTKLKDKLSLVKPQYMPVPEEFLCVEHLNMVRKSPDHRVNMTSLRRVILQGNALPVAFESGIQSKTASEGDAVNFVFNKPVYTDEGSLLIPAGSKLAAEVTMIEHPRKFNHCAKVYLEYKQLTLPNGATYNIGAKTFNKDSALKESYWQTGLKLASFFGAFNNGLSYKSKAGEKVKIMLTEDLSLTNPERIINNK